MGAVPSGRKIAQPKRRCKYNDFIYINIFLKK